MDNSELDWTVSNLYGALSFENKKGIDASTIKSLCFQDGLLVNNSFKDPIIFAAETFIQSLESLVAEGSMDQFLQREVWSKTDVFGKVAQRLSVYEYSFADHPVEHMPKGINFIQFIQVEGLWKITSMVWADENENHIIPAEHLGK